jgi:hypothetical protein
VLSKKKILKVTKELPEQSSIEELFDRINFLQKIETGLEQSKADKVLTTDQAKRRLEKWILK